jgi:hypothetical protein
MSSVLIGTRVKTILMNQNAGKNKEELKLQSAVILKLTWDKKTSYYYLLIRLYRLA